jgi:hypothetical protein
LGEQFQGAEPPVAATLEEYLNSVFGKQANVTFSVRTEPPILVNSSEFEPASFILSPWEVSARNMMHALWNEAAPGTNDHIVLFWMPHIQEGVIAEAFNIRSRGAIVGPNADFKAVAHELGHCFGLHHCWTSRGALPYSTMTDVPDNEQLRLMGYHDGELLRHQEAVTVNLWNPNSVNIFGPPLF